MLPVERLAELDASKLRVSRTVWELGHAVAQPKATLLGHAQDACSTILGLIQVLGFGFTQAVLHAPFALYMGCALNCSCKCVEEIYDFTGCVGR